MAVQAEALRGGEERGEAFEAQEHRRARPLEERGRYGDDAPAREQDRYGRTEWGWLLLLARRLVEAGVPLVQVTLDRNAGWDTHRDNFPRVRALSQECDAAMAALVADLESRGLLDSTLVVWMGEFGRTPQCTGGGRNHWSRAWSACCRGLPRPP